MMTSQSYYNSSVDDIKKYMENKQGKTTDI